jgi:hypothetical protein
MLCEVRPVILPLLETVRDGIDGHFLFPSAFLPDIQTSLRAPLGLELRTLTGTSMP